VCPRVKVSILGGHSMGHYVTSCVCMCPILNSFQYRAVSLYSCKVVDKEEILRTVSDTDIDSSRDEAGTVYLV
jgi:hypothetical protein